MFLLLCLRAAVCVRIFALALKRTCEYISSDGERECHRSSVGSVKISLNYVEDIRKENPLKYSKQFMVAV